MWLSVIRRQWLNIGTRRVGVEQQNIKYNMYAPLPVQHYLHRPAPALPALFCFCGKMGRDCLCVMYVDAFDQLFNFLTTTSPPKNHPTQFHKYTNPHDTPIRAVKLQTCLPVESAAVIAPLGVRQRAARLAIVEPLALEPVCGFVSFGGRMSSCL